ncbi:TPA: hypothetical protein U5G31_005092 [Klebsiella pneumoniae]|nr:hypothetical protein [Klebsiella pneumoniae]HEN3754577.1 hypothetical protein [Klebsiella pneumoniae]
MKIVNLLGNDFDDACRRLHDHIEEKYHPELIIGIATGGAVVVEKMKYQEDRNILIIKKQRPFTKTKNKMKFDSWLPYLPEWINNILRLAELSFNEYRFNKKGIIDNDSTGIEILKGNVEDIFKAKKILIVDDSVDSGATLKNCVQFIGGIMQTGTEIKTASLNVTFKKPAIFPTFLLYNRTIVRYPWANDVRKK